MFEYEHLFPNTPTRTNKIYHDIDIESSKPIKRHPLYRMNPMKLQYLREEIQFLLDNDFIGSIQSDWSSPCVLVRARNRLEHFVCALTIEKCFFFTKTDRLISSAESGRLH